MFKEILKAVHEVNKKDAATNERLIVKALEELGELAETINWKSGYKKTDKDLFEINEASIKESIDVLVYVFAILDKLNPSNEKIVKYFNEKLKKWNKKLDNLKKLS